MKPNVTKFVATAVVTMAKACAHMPCLGPIYQPKLPESLKK